MTDIARNERRVLLLTPTGKDAQLISGLLLRAGYDVLVCQNAPDLCSKIGEGAVAVILAEEALPGPSAQGLIETMLHQPPWSDLPLIVLTMGGKTTRHTAQLAMAFQGSVNLAFLERPLRMLTLVSAVRVACRARERQYEVRDLLGKSAEEISKRDQFIAMLGHELRNPLAAIRNSIEILKHFGSGDSSLVVEPYDVIDRQSKHMSRLVDDMLDVARLTSGRVNLSKARVDLRECISRSVQGIRLAKSIDAHAIKQNLPEEPVMIEGDVVRLEQVFGNLLSNSIRYSPAGSSVEISLRTDEACAFVRVKDDGDGIEADLLPRIFEPFVQSSQPLSRFRGGLGLGLTIVRSLIELHGGSISAASDGPGKGSEFVVCLPLLNVEVCPAQTASPGAKPASVGKTVLVVEDNNDARHSLSMLLRLLKHEVFEASDGQDGLQKLISIRPNLALVDIGLPQLSGYEVATQARSKIGRDTILVALTGYGQAEDRERAFAAGFDAHLVKPVDVRQISELLSTLP